jgi:arylsulfatase A-like enzyme
MEVPSLKPYADRDWPEPQKGHAAMITRMDRDIGRLLAKLKELRLDDKTLVLFTSDNGPHREGGNNPEFNDSNGPLRGIKRDLYEGGIRVPLIARWPGTIKPGRVTDHVSAFWDFLPTACQIVGVESPAGVDGISYLPTLLGNDDRQKEHEYLYWEFRSKQAVRMGKWKAVWLSPSRPVELYELESDLGEANDVSDRHPDVAARMERIRRTAHRDSPLFPLDK